MPHASDKIAVIGANGYVGSFLMEALKEHTQLFGIVHSASSVFKKLPNANYYTVNETHDEVFDIVVNTAYSNGRTLEQCRLQNEELLAYLKKHTHQYTKIIHLSSLAVFGINLDKPIVAQPISNRIDEVYVYSKLHMENLLLSHFASHQLQLLRIGNIWGPANSSWTQPLADAVLYHLPVKYTGKTYSNTTFIHNLIDYLIYVMKSNNHLLIHHVAEFSDIGWNQWILWLEEAINSKAETFSEAPFYPTSLYEQLSQTRFHTLREFLISLKNGRFTACYMHKLMHFASQIKGRKKSTSYKLPVYHVEDMIQTDILCVLSCSTPFTPVMLAGWQAPYSPDQAFESIKSWLRKAGYIRSGI